MGYLSLCLCHVTSSRVPRTLCRKFEARPTTYSNPITTRGIRVLCSHRQALIELHLNYETMKEYRLKWIENKAVSINWRVEKMNLSKEKDSLRVNEWLTLSGIPQECFQYRLGNRSALEWVIDQYKVSTDVRSGIVSDPNREDDEQYIVRLIRKVVTVSVETVKLVKELAQQ